MRYGMSFYSGRLHDTIKPLFHSDNVVLGLFLVSTSIKSEIKISQPKLSRGSPISHFRGARYVTPR